MQCARILTRLGFQILARFLSRRETHRDRDGRLYLGFRSPTTIGRRSKTIQNLKEIAKNQSDDEIYSMLRDCNMDPNETAQKLLFQVWDDELERQNPEFFKVYKLNRMVKKQICMHNILFLAFQATIGNLHNATTDSICETNRIFAYWALSLSAGGLLALFATETRAPLFAGFLSLIAAVSLATITVVDMRSPPPWGLIRSMDCLLKGLVVIFMLTLFAALLM